MISYTTLIGQSQSGLNLRKMVPSPKNCLTPNALTSPPSQLLSSFSELTVSNTVAVLHYGIESIPSNTCFASDKSMELHLFRSHP